jgi:superfamily I DNA/RNA helicase
MTAHAAKGLEFPVVFMAVWDQEFSPVKEFGERPSDRKRETAALLRGHDQS